MPRRYLLAFSTLSPLLLFAWLSNLQLWLPPTYYLDQIVPKNSFFVELRGPRNRSNAFDAIYPLCTALWNRNASHEAIKKAIRKKSHVLNQKIEYCYQYFQHQSHFFNSEPVNEFEENFPIAFSILAYHEFDQMEQMFLAIFRRQNFNCIHVDASSTEQFRSKVRKWSFTQLQK